MNGGMEAGKWGLGNIMDLYTYLPNIYVCHINISLIHLDLQDDKASSYRRRTQCYIRCFAFFLQPEAGTKGAVNIESYLREDTTVSCETPSGQANDKAGRGLGRVIGAAGVAAAGQAAGLGFGTWEIPRLVAYYVGLLEQGPTV